MRRMNATQSVKCEGAIVVTKFFDCAIAGVRVLRQGANALTPPTSKPLLTF